MAGSCQYSVLEVFLQLAHALDFSYVHSEVDPRLMQIHTERGSCSDHTMMTEGDMISPSVSLHCTLTKILSMSQLGKILKSCKLIFEKYQSDPDDPVLGEGVIGGLRGRVRSGRSSTLQCSSKECNVCWLC